MNEKEKRDFYIANCKCCLLAETMKDCPMCKFNIGLSEKVDTVSNDPFLKFAANYLKNIPNGAK